MKKSELLRALQTEIQKHNLSTYMSKEHKIVQTGCSFCKKHFGTVEQFKRHLTDEVLPALIDKISVEQHGG
jgi:nucleoside recognition membrane protein YjiH